MRAKNIFFLLLTRSNFKFNRHVLANENSGVMRSCLSIVKAFVAR